MAKKKKYVVKGKAGTGARFKRLKKTLAKRKGVKNPGALAAFIGRKKFGKRRMAKMAAAGRRSDGRRVKK
mgnify:FL=1